MSGKVQIISAILKLDRPFRPPHIIDMTGLDRQLVRYHLTKFCEDGYLEKIDKVYVLRDKEGMFDSLTETTEKLDTRKMQPGGFYTKATVDSFNAIAESIVSLRMLNSTVANEAREVMVKKIDESLKELKTLRKFLMNAQRTEQTTAKRYMKADLGEIYDGWINGLKFVPSVDKATFKAQIVETLEKWDD